MLTTIGLGLRILMMLQVEGSSEACEVKDLMDAVSSTNREFDRSLNMLKRLGFVEHPPGDRDRLRGTSRLHTSSVPEFLAAMRIDLIRRSWRRRAPEDVLSNFRTVTESPAAMDRLSTMVFRSPMTGLGEGREQGSGAKIRAKTRGGTDFGVRLRGGDRPENESGDRAELRYEGEACRVPGWMFERLRTLADWHGMDLDETLHSALLIGFEYLEEEYWEAESD